ncbi:MAG: hypothetical protein R3F43_18230 [bacterium]
MDEGRRRPDLRPRGPLPGARQHLLGAGRRGLPQALPELKDVVDEATEGRGLLPGNLQRACSGLTWESQARDLEPRFTWQQMGDVRFSFIWWVNEAQPSGPLGYGPSSPDPETGRIVSGNAYIYGAAVDEYARRSADIVRAINGELCDGDADQTDCLVQGRSYLDWLGRGGAARRPRKWRDHSEYQRMISDRLGGAGMAAGRSFMTEKGVDKAAMRRNMSDRMERPRPATP